jgi:hypothetical protein
LCEQYGYPVDANNPEEISEGLSLIVADNGEKGLKDVMDIHPDKQVILELAKNAKRHLNFIGHDDECPTCRKQGMGYPEYPLSRSFNASGDATTSNAIQTQTSAMMQQSTLIMVGALFIGGVLLFRK